MLFLTLIEWAQIIGVWIIGIDEWHSMDVMIMGEPSIIILILNNNTSGIWNSAREMTAYLTNDPAGTLDKISDILSAFTKVLISLAIIGFLYFIARKIFRKEEGIVIMPFDTFSEGLNKKYDGKAISNLLTYELQKISNIHNQEIPQVPIRIPQTSYLFKDNYKLRSEVHLLSGPVPKSETFEYSVSEMGTIKTGVLELSLGQLLTAFKRLLSDEYRYDMITGSLQEYGSYMNIVANMEGDGIHAWKVSRKITEGDPKRGDHIQFMVKDLAFQIAHHLARRQYGPEDSAESWLSWKYYTEALEAYNEFARSKRGYDLNKARKNCLLALRIGGEYDKPLELLSYLGYYYLNEEENIKIAKNIFDRVRMRDPDLAARGLGILNLTDLNYRDALMYLKIAIQKNQQDSMAWFCMGMAHEGLVNEPTIDEVPSEVMGVPAIIDSVPSVVGPQIVDEDPHLYDQALFDKSQDKALKYALDAYNKTIEIDPKHGDAWYRVGLIHCKSREFEEAIKAFESALNIDPKNAGMWYHKGVVLSQRDNYEGAIVAYNEVIKIDPPYFVGYANEPRTHPYVPLSWLYKGVALSKLGKYYEADHAYSKSLNTDSGKAVSLYYKGMNQGILGNYREALDAFSRAVDEDKNYPSARFMKLLLNAFLGLDRPELALNASDEALQLVDKYDALKQRYMNSAFTVVRGIALSSLGRYLDALKCFDDAIEHDPEDAFIWNRKHLALKALGRDSEAEAASAKADELGYVAPPRWIKVHFKKESIRADSGVIIIDGQWQVSESNPSEVLINEDKEVQIECGSPLKLEHGYELSLKSIDATGKRLELELNKDGTVIDSTMLGDNVQYIYEYQNMAIEDANYLRSSHGFLSTFSI